MENNIKYKLGRNAKENFELIDEAYELNDKFWWFHLEEYPSGHCIVHTELIDKTIAQFAASLVKQYSKLRNHKKVKVIYIQIKAVKKNKTIGEVVVLNKPTIISI